MYREIIVWIVVLSLSLVAVEPEPEQLKILNLKEELWLKERIRPLKVGITQIPNQILKSPQGYEGFSIDLFRQIETLLNIEFQFVYFDTWDELLRAGKRREIDIIFLAQKTEKRLALYDFTDIVLTQQNKIVTTFNNHSNIELNELKGKRVAVVKKSAIAKYLELNYPKITLVESPNELKSLDMVSKKSVDYTIVEAVRASYYIKEHNINNLYIVGDTHYDYKLRVASRNDFPILNIILNKAIEHISDAKKKSFALKWGYIKDKEVFFDKRMLITLAIIGFMILLFLLYLSILNRRLKEAQRELKEINATLEKRIEEEVEKNRKKELIMLNQSRLAQMGQVLNMVAHQWRQPLNNLLLINEILVFKYEKNGEVLTAEDIQEFQDESTLQIKQMSGTIDDFRDFFHPRKEKNQFLFNEVIEHLLVIIKPIFLDAKIEIIYHEQKDIYINGYSNELAQAILNILYNAKDALIEHQESKRVLEISLIEQKSKAILQISDNAGGISDEIILNIFDPYFSTKKSKNGTGIGLYMSKMIIEKHMKGRLLVDNKNGGATFQIELDIA